MKNLIVKSIFRICIAGLLIAGSSIEARAQLGNETPGANQSDGGNSDFQPIPEIPVEISPPVTELEFVDQFVSGDFSDKFGPFFGEPASASSISAELAELGGITGTKPGLVYVLKRRSGIRLVLVTANQEPEEILPNGQDVSLISSAVVQPSEIIVQNDEQKLDQFAGTVITKKVRGVSPKKVDKTVKGLIRRVSDPSNLDSTTYLKYSQELYDWMIRPISEEIEARGIDTLIFVMDEGLRTLPISVLHDGENFLVEKYNVSLIPSFNLTDTRYKPISGAQMLGLGISESVQGLSPLPSVSLEVPTLAKDIWQGQFFLNDGATLERLQDLTRQKSFDIIHLATHAEFKPGDFSKSYIQLWDQRVSFADLRNVAIEAQWSQNPTIELIVLSACQTAIGNLDAELGFSGLALQTGAKSALGSLWFVSDEGTLALMSEFYSALNSAPIKSAALREAQLSMISGATKIADNKLTLASGLEVELPEKLQGITRDKLNHPYYWSAFTLVGNWN